MAETNSKQPTIDVFPHIDIATELADELVLPMQNADILNFFHNTVHRANSLYRIAHKAVELTSTEAIEEEDRTNALLLGCEVYEVIGMAVRSESYDSELAEKKAYENARRMCDPVNVEAFTDRATYAAKRLVQDAPVLHGIIREIASKQLGHNNMAIDYAIAGAGIMRGMQIRTDRQIAA